MMRYLRCVLLILLLSGCVASPATETTEITATRLPAPSPTPPPQPTPSASVEGLSAAEVATLESLAQVDDHPLYTMTYYGEYDTAAPALMGGEPWACSLFAALGDPDHMVYGRNFDWVFSPAVLLFTDPTDGYASVSMVDIAYLGFAEENACGLTDLPLADREALLVAPLLPFDGMNETGLTVGFAAVPPGDMTPDPDKETVDSLMVVRLILDQAGTVDEALRIFETYNIDMGGGPPLHYLVADRSGRSLLIEFYQGEMVIMANEEAWQAATNFLRAEAGEDTEGWCWRYDRITQRLSETEGRLTVEGAMDLLNEASQEITEWSIVYRISSGEVAVSMGRRYGTVHAFDLGGR